MALFKIFNNFNNPSKTIDDITNHNTGFCYFDASTNKFYVDTTDTNAGVKQLNGTFYGECSTIGETAIKTATITGFSLVKGISVLIKFTYENSANVDELKLNISNTGAVSIKRYGSSNLNAKNAILAGMICQFVYDGTNWIWVGQMNTDTDTKVSQSLVSTNSDRPILLAYPDSTNVQTTITNNVYRSNNIKANPSTGTITATNFVGKVNGHVLEQDITSSMALTDTTYTAGGGLDLEGTEFVNTGVRAIGTGTENGTISVNTAGVSGNVAVKGLKALAFVDKAPGNNTTVFLNGAGEWVTVAATDTKNTAGATNTFSKIYLIGATAQDAEPQTYSNSGVYVGTDGALYSNGTKVLTSHQDITSKANLNSPAFTGAPTAPTAAAGTSSTQIATTEFVMNSFGANDAMVFKGLIGGLGNIQELPNPHKQGWTYKVAENGTYAGQSCEFGDTIYCILDGETANDNHWAVLQTNLDGAVIGPNSSTTDHVAVFSGTTGKAIKDSGFTIGKSVPANAVFTDTTYEIANSYNADNNPLATVRTVATAIENLTLSSIQNTTDLQAIEGLSGTTGFLKKTGENTWALDTNNYVTSSGVTSITLNAGTGISISTDGVPITSTATPTISLSASGVTANTYGETTTQSLSHSGNFYIPYFTVDTYGRLTAAGTTEYSMPTETITGVKGSSESTYRTGNVSISKSNIGLGNVENTKLSTWSGSGNINTVGEITASGSWWKANPVEISYGGTGASTAAGARTNLGIGSVGTLNYDTTGASTTKYLRQDGTWVTPPNDTYTNGAGLTLNSGTFAHATPEGAEATTLGNSTTRYYIKTITTDQFGHVTGVTTGNETVTNTDTKMRQTLESANKNRPILLSYGETSNTNTNVDNISYRNNSIYANTSTGTITATAFSGNGAALTNLNVSNLTGTLPINKGGTNATTAADARTNLGIGNVGTLTYATSNPDNAKFLRNDGTWATVGITVAGHSADSNGNINLDKLTLFGQEYDGSTPIQIITSDLGLSSSMSFLGIITQTLSDGSTTVPVTLRQTGTNKTPTEGDVVIDATGKEYVYSENVWQNLGYATNYALDNHIHGNITTAGGLSNTNVAIGNGDQIIVYKNNLIAKSAIAFDGTSEGLALSKAGTWVSVNNYTLPAATTEALGGIKIGFQPTNSTDKNYAVQLDTNNKAFVAVPWTDTLNTAGSTNNNNKLFLIGATSQGANPQTYSNINVYETAGVMYANDYVGRGTVEYIKGTQTAATGSWTGTSKRSSLQDGDLIAYYLPVAGSGNASLNLTLADGTTTGAKEIYRYAKTTRITTHFSAGSILFMAYNAVNDVWNIQNWYDTTVNYQLRNSNNSKAAAAIAAGAIVVGSSAGYKQVASGVTFTLDYPIMFNGTARAANAVNCTDLYYDRESVNLQTTKSSWTGTQWSTVYLVGTLINRTVTIDSSVFTTTIPNSADGKVYFPIGVLYSTYQCYFHPTGQMFAYLNNRFSQVSPKDIKTITRSGNTFTATRVDGETFTFNYEQGSISTNYIATIGTSWTGTTAPYTQTITVTGIKATDVPIVDIYLADTAYKDVEDQLTAYSYIYRITTAANAITVYASEPTDVPIKIQMKVC